MSGLAGAFLVVGQNYSNGQTGGRGFIGLAALIFGNWRPGGMAIGRRAVRLHRRRPAVRLRPARPCTPSCCWWRSRWCSWPRCSSGGASGLVAVVATFIAALALYWFFNTDTLPRQLVTAAPVRDHPAGAGSGLAAAAAAGRRRHAVSKGRADDDATARTSTGSRCGPWRSRRPARRTARTRACRSGWRRSSTTVGSSPAATSRTPPTDWVCAPSAPWSDSCGCPGGGRLVALACRSGEGELLMPCGRCRQVIYEFGGPELLVDTPSGVQPMSWVLPDAFGPEHLPA